MLFIGATTWSQSSGSIFRRSEAQAGPCNIEQRPSQGGVIEKTIHSTDHTLFVCQTVRLDGAFQGLSLEGSYYGAYIPLNGAKKVPTPIKLPSDDLVFSSYKISKEQDPSFFLSFPEGGIKVNVKDPVAEFKVICDEKSCAAKPKCLLSKQEIGTVQKAAAHLTKNLARGVEKEEYGEESQRLLKLLEQAGCRPTKL